ncbi:response regulator [Sphingobium nicotianae]|uniref:histidine kinase n=1 Tax=Sphingobium nicotianae TaxID=2782607 RepID=A0A9X1DG62_9SPHN|nr:response regulator [Sphingobium nicotianae]MBT2189380.1 response regulator [Sphingobium nicotianae]
MLSLTADKPRLSPLPVILGAALLSGAILLWLIKDAILAGGFAAAVIAGGALIWYARRLFPTREVDQAVVTDWAVTRAAAQAAGLAIAVTDRTGRIVCASDQYGEWFPGYPVPPEIKVSTRDQERLVAAGRAAWRDGEAEVPGILRGSLQLDLNVVRTGRVDDYLLWRFASVRQASVMDDYLRIIEGEAGKQISDAGMMCVMIGGEGRIRAANLAFTLRATGRSDSNIIGRDFAGYMRVDAKGRIFFAQEESQATPIRMIQVPLRPDDPQSLLVLVMLDDTVASVDGISSLAYVETLLSLLPFGLGMADRDGRLLFYNNAFGRAAGIAADEKPSYPGDLVIGEDQAAVAESIRRYAIGPQMSGDIQVRLRGAPDEPVPLSLAGVRGLGEAAVLLSLKDNSEESRLKKQVAQATKMQAVGQLAGGVAHDFNNILTAIIGHCDLMLMRHTPGDSDYDDIQQVKANSNRAASLTRQLLAFSRQQTLRPQVLQLPDVVADVSSLLKRLLGENVKLEVAHGRNLGTVRADPGQLEQVIVNLVVNARDAMPEGGTVSIRTFAVSAQDVRDMKHEIMPIGDYTGVSVGDTGTGIAPELLGKIFEPFYTTKPVGRGTGLGLSTVYGIVKQSGGFIFPESEVGKGTVFKIYLPVHAAAAEPNGGATSKVKRAATETWGTGTILLVEDEDMVRTVAERALTRQGYTVVTASDGEQGLARLSQTEKIDLLISDVVMPVMDGPTMVRAARAAHPHLPVLFMSGYAEEQLRNSIDIDEVAFLPKPFSVNQLAEAARDVLATAREAAAGREPMIPLVED